MADAVSVRPLRPAAQIGLRGDGSDAGFLATLGRACGLAVPTVPNTATAADGRSLVWLGPTEWLLVSDAEPAADLLPTLASAVAPHHGAAIDLSAAQAVREVAGPAARGLLARGCAIDLHPRCFGPGRTAQTLFARTRVLLHQCDATPTFRLYVRPSFAAYLDAWLAVTVADLK